MGKEYKIPFLNAKLLMHKYVVLKNSLDSIIDNSADSIRFYLLGNHWEGKVEHIGIDNSFNFNADLII